MIGTLEDRVAELVGQLHGRSRASALCNLTGLGTAAIPLVEAAYGREANATRRATLVQALSQFRDTAVLPALSAGLRDLDDRVWKEALDGIVTVGGSLALPVLRTAREAVGTFKDAAERRRWIDEAVEQVTSSR
jgi:hypothetical protein